MQSHIGVAYQELFVVSTVCGPFPIFQSQWPITSDTILTDSDGLCDSFMGLSANRGSSNYIIGYSVIHH